MGGSTFSLIVLQASRYLIETLERVASVLHLFQYHPTSRSEKWLLFWFEYKRYWVSHQNRYLLGNLPQLFFFIRLFAFLDLANL